MLNQTFYSTKAGCPDEDFGCASDLDRSLLIAFYFQRKHAPKHRHLPFRDFMAGVVRQSGIMYAADCGMTSQELGHFHGVLAVRPHPPRHRPHSAQNQPAIKRRGDSTGRILDRANSLEKFGLLLRHHDSTENIAMTTKIFSGRI